MWSTIRYESRIRFVRHKTNLFEVRICSHDTVRIHGFAKRIHVFTNLLYNSRILNQNTYFVIYALLPFLTTLEIVFLFFNAYIKSIISCLINLFYFKSCFIFIYLKNLRNIFICWKFPVFVIQYSWISNFTILFKWSHIKYLVFSFVVRFCILSGYSEKIFFFIIDFIALFVPTVKIHTLLATLITLLKFIRI